MARVVIIQAGGGQNLCWTLNDGGTKINLQPRNDEHNQVVILKPDDQQCTIVSLNKSGSDNIETVTLKPYTSSTSAPPSSQIICIESQDKTSDGKQRVLTTTKNISSHSISITNSIVNFCI